MKNFRQYFALMLVSVLLIGCNERKNDTPIAQTSVSIHGEGFSNPASSNFHAKYIQTKNYDLTLCQSCHGSDYSGGTTGQSCNTCHNKQNGPENCTTCHGSVNAAPPNDLVGNSSPTYRGVGAHQKHLLAGTLGAAVSCNECHKVPVSIAEAGHIDLSMLAEIRFDSTSIFFKSNAVYNAGNMNCSNTYCHGNFNGGNQNIVMAWSTSGVGSTSAACGTCHGDVAKTTLEEKAFPKTGHPAIGTQKCYQCHFDVVNASMAIINPLKHINGRIN